MAYCEIPQFVRILWWSESITSEILKNVISSRINSSFVYIWSMLSAPNTSSFILKEAWRAKVSSKNTGVLLVDKDIFETFGVKKYKESNYAISGFGERLAKTSISKASGRACGKTQKLPKTKMCFKEDEAHLQMTRRYQKLLDWNNVLI